jgi:hypothetical protein
MAPSWLAPILLRRVFLGSNPTLLVTSEPTKFFAL